MAGLIKLGIWVGVIVVLSIILTAIVKFIIGLFFIGAAVEIARDTVGPNAPTGEVAFSFFWNGIVGHLLWPIFCLFVAESFNTAKP